MYLISCYFDEKSQQKINQMILEVAKETQNHFMIDHHVPSHLTLFSFDLNDEKKCIDEFLKIDLHMLSLQIISYGILASSVLEYNVLYSFPLFQFQQNIFTVLNTLPDIHFSQYYQPFSYFPHITLAKKLNETELKKGVDLLIEQFEPFSVQVVKMELSKTHPFSILATKKLSD